MNPKRWLTLPAKFRFVEKQFGQKPFRLLDIGAGNHSATITKKWFPNCEFHGVDLDKNYNNSEEDFRLMHSFYELNLELLQFEKIPDNYFDCILMAHVIEHLKNGDEVLKKLLPKLKQDGLIYVEFPGIHSTKLPHMKGTLNFYDDPTHVRIYSVKEISELFRDNNFRVVASGTRRYWPNILLMPLKIFHNLIVYHKILPSIFWDALGFAEFVAATKNQ